MTRTILSAVLMMFLSVGFETESADPVEVTIVFTDGGQLEGEILVLRESSMVVTNVAGISLIELERRPGCAFLIAHSQIRSIRTAGGKILLSGSKRDFDTLRKVARYSDSEPESLRSIAS